MSRAPTARRQCRRGRLRRRSGHATLHQRITAVRLFYDYLMEEGLRSTNPVGRPLHSARVLAAPETRTDPRFTKLPWIRTTSSGKPYLMRPVRIISESHDAGVVLRCSSQKEELCGLKTSISTCPPDDHHPAETPRPSRTSGSVFAGHGRSVRRVPGRRRELSGSAVLCFCPNRAAMRTADLEMDWSRWSKDLGPRNVRSSLRTPPGTCA